VSVCSNAVLLLCLLFFFFFFWVLFAFLQGSGVIKAGFAGDTQPKCYFPSYVGRPKHTRVMAGGPVDGDYFIGSKVQDCRGLLKVRARAQTALVLTATLF